MARKKSRQPAHGQSNLFGAETTHFFDEGKEVENGRRHQGIEASQESLEVAGAAHPDQHAGESTAGTAGEDDTSPAGTAAVVDPTVAQPPVEIITPREDSSHPSESSGDAQDVGDLLPSGGLPGSLHPKDDSMEFHRKLHKFSVEQWAVIAERSRIDRERRKPTQKR